MRRSRASQATKPRGFGAVALLVMLLAAGTIPTTSAHDPADRPGDAATAFLTPPSGLAPKASAVTDPRAATPTDFSWECETNDATLRHISGTTWVSDTCPTRVIDAANLFGNIDLATWEENPQVRVFTSLHGQPHPGANGRDNARGPAEAFTIFVDEGDGMWHDFPTREGGSEALSGGGAEHQPMGMDTAVAMDAGGAVYYGYLTERNTQNPQSARSTVRLHASSGFSPPEIRSGMEGRNAAAYQAGNHTVQTSLHLTMVPALGTQPQRVIGSWMARDTRLASTLMPDGNGTGMTRTGIPTPGYFEWTTLVGDDVWIKERLIGRNPDGERLGPCYDTSPPVHRGGTVYVACSVAPGYDARPRAHPFDVDIWGIDAASGTARYISATPVVGADPVLAVNDNGYWVLAASQVLDDGSPDGSVALGPQVERLTEMNQDFGGVLEWLLGSADLIDTKVTAAAIADNPSTAFLLVHAYYDTDSKAGRPVDDPTRPPEAAAASEATDRFDHRKLILSLDECDGVTGYMDLQIGRSPAVTPDGGSPRQPPASAFNDDHDGLVFREGEDGVDRLHLAVDDWGVAQVGTVRIDAVPGGCFPPKVIPFIQAVPIPEAVALSNTATTVLSAGIGVVATAAMAYLVAMRRKNALSVAAEA